MLRRIYGGTGLGGAILPPTDPRILALTDHQIEIEFEQFEQAGLFEKDNKEAYKDDEFEDYEAELDADTPEHTAPKPPIQESSNAVEIPDYDGEWEDDEIFDFEDDES